jgi:hypothetical protein
MEKPNIFKGIPKKVIDFIKFIDKKISGYITPAKPILVPIEKDRKNKR